jgi:hypothetical protein
MLDLMLVSEISKLPPCTGNESFGVMDMAFDLKLKVRGLRTVQKDQDWRKNELWVYRPQDTYAMGWICYADHMTGGDGENRYSVFSPNISNGKYTHGDRGYMSSALNRDTAVKNAAKYLRPLTLQQTVRLVQKEFKHKLNTAAQQMGTELRGLTSELRDGFRRMHCRTNSIESCSRTMCLLTRNLNRRYAPRSLREKSTKKVGSSPTWTIRLSRRISWGAGSVSVHTTR